MIATVVGVASTAEERAQTRGVAQRAFGHSGHALSQSTEACVDLGAIRATVVGHGALSNSRRRLSARPWSDNDKKDEKKTRRAIPACATREVEYIHSASCSFHTCHTAPSRHICRHRRVVRNTRMHPLDPSNNGPHQARFMHKGWRLCHRGFCFLVASDTTRAVAVVGTLRARGTLEAVATFAGERMRTATDGGSGRHGISVKRECGHERPCAQRKEKNARREKPTIHFNPNQDEV
jgi:hypothetical protein